MNEVLDYRFALQQIAQACSKPFGKDARTAKRIALYVLAKLANGCATVEKNEKEV